MTIERHSLAKEFPEYRQQIHDLKMNDAHFAKLFDQYHDVDHAIVRMEEGVENVCDETLNQNRKQRLQLKDALFDMIKAEIA